MERFFSALRTRDLAKLDTLLTPHATVARVEQGRLVSQGSYRVALQQDSGASALLQYASVPLANFRMTSVDNAQIETHVTTRVDNGTQTTNFRWHLIRAGPIWRIQRSEEMMWIDEETGGEA